QDGRWWCWGFLPPGPGHPAPCVAVGCDGGVSIHRLSDGRRTRYLAGHSGPGMALAASPDGRWLVTGSIDPRARLWTLDGCDRIAPLGATFTRAPDGTRTVSAVVKGGHADRMGLKAGDVLTRFGSGGVEAKTPAEREAFFAGVDALPPGTKIEV